MKLHEFQSDFKDFILERESDSNQRSPLYTNERDKTGMQIYRNNVRNSLTTALFQTFPTLKKLVGEDFLRAAFHAFILKTPPSQGYINLYGQGFDSFLQHYTPAKTIPYLPDMAKFELALNSAYYAPNDIIIDPQNLLSLSEDQLSTLYLRLNSSVFLLLSVFPLQEIYAYCKDETYPMPNTNLHQERFWMIFRPCNKVKIIPLEKDEFTFLRHTEDGLCLGETLEKTLESCPSFDFSAFWQKHFTSLRL